MAVDERSSGDLFIAADECGKSGAAARGKWFGCAPLWLAGNDMSLRRQMEKRIDSPDAVASRREGREKCGRMETHCSHCCERPISLLLSWGGDHAVRVGMSHMKSVWLRIQMGRGQTSSKVGADDVRRKPYGKNANVFCGEQRGGPMGRNDASPRRSSEPPALCIFLRSTRR